MCVEKKMNLFSYDIREVSRIWKFFRFLSRDLLIFSTRVSFDVQQQRTVLEFVNLKSGNSNRSDSKSYEIDIRVTKYSIFLLYSVLVARAREMRVGIFASCYTNSSILNAQALCRGLLNTYYLISRGERSKKKPLGVQWLCTHTYTNKCTICSVPRWRQLTQNAKSLEWFMNQLMSHLMWHLLLLLIQSNDPLIFNSWLMILETMK